MKKLFSDSIVYGFSGVLNRLIGFLLLPLYSKILLPSDYGVLGLYNNSVFLLFILLVFGMDSATFRFYYDSKESNTKKSTTATWIWFQFMLSGVLLLIAFLFNNIVGKLIFNLPDGGTIFLCLSIILLLQALPNIQEIWFRIQQKPWGAFTFAISISAINILFTFYYIVVCKDGYWGFIKGQLISYLIGTIVSLYLLRHYLSVKYFNIKLLKDMLTYGASFVPALFMIQGTAWLCSYFMKSRINYNELGIYNMGNTFASILTLVTSSFAQAFTPYAYSIIKEDNSIHIYAKIFLIYISGISMLCLGYVLFSQEILAMVTQPIYSGASLVMIILAYHYFFLSTTTMGMLGASIQKKSSPYAIAVAFATIASFILFFIFIPWLGKEGAALALLIGQLLVPIITFRSSHKLYPIPYKFWTALILIVASICVGFTARFLLISLEFKLSFSAKIFIKVALFISYVYITLLYLSKKNLVFIPLFNKKRI